MVNNGQNLVNVVKERSLCRIGRVSTSINLCTALNRVEGRDIEFTWFQGCSLKVRMNNLGAKPCFDQLRNNRAVGKV